MGIEGARILILGLAREGVSLARFFAEEGALVTVTDSAPDERLTARLQALHGLPIRSVLGGDHPELVLEADTLYVSPGVPEGNPVYRAARDVNLPIQSMTTLFFDRCPGQIIGITGSSGKTTTTGLIGHMLRSAGRKTVVGGNIGDPMLDLLPDIDADTTVVLELSSFQLQLLRRSPRIAVVTNISPNHLDRHGTMEAYIDAKLNIVRNQRESDAAVLNAADAESGRFAAATPAQLRWFGDDATTGAALRGDTIGVVRDGDFRAVMSSRDVPLLGRHNLENVLAAVAAVDLLGVPLHQMAGAIRTYRPAPHRLETVAVRDGVRYVDDSIATSPARASVALQAIDAPILLIAGGRDKKLPWEEFARLVAERARALFLIGEAAEQIERAVRDALREVSGALSETTIHRCESLEHAVQSARATARPGDVVLLSPACTSYDMFSDFEERGQVFARTVEALHAA